jgi:sulfatase-like protein
VSGRRAFAASFLLLALGACGRHAASSRHDGPIVLITLDALRADVVGGLGGDPELTPHLDEFLRQADWVGRAIAPSSWGVPAMASLLTGLRPWQHQALIAGRAVLSPDLLTLAEALKAAGYKTAGYPTGHWYTTEFGYGQGFDVFQELGRGRDAAERLSDLDGGREFVWVHLPEPQAPYVRRDWLLPRLGAMAALPLPRRIEPLQLESFFDPAVLLAPGNRRRFWAMYRLNVAWADERLGRLLDALKASGQWERALVVVTSDYGEEFGERGQIGHGGNLGRQLLEVPLAIKLPAGFPLRLAPPRGQRVATQRLWATLVEAAGGRVPPAVAPSLFRRSPSPVLSELYLTNAYNQFSLVDGDFQLLWRTSFAAVEPEYYRARFESMAGQVVPPLAEPAEAIFDRLYRGFASTPPLTGRGAPQLALERWGPDGGSVPVVDPERTARMARLLAATWSRFVGAERPPDAEAQEWAGAR